MEDVLLDAAQRRQLGQHDGGQPVCLHQRQPAPHLRRDHDPLELGEHALGRHPLDRRGVARHLGRRRGLELEVELDREAAGPQGPQRVLGQRGGGHHPHPPRREVGTARVRVEQLAAAQRLGHRVDREVARRQVGGDVAVAQRDEVDVPALVAPHDPPGAELPREAERRAARRARDAGRGLARVARHGDVEVARGTPQQPVAHRAADEPGRLAGERLAGGGQRIGHGERTCSRGTRAEMPQVTS